MSDPTDSATPTATGPAPRRGSLGIVRFFTRNAVAANLLMIMIIAGGVYSALQIKRETMPVFTPDSITISVPHLGAGPEEVEEGVVIRIEEAVRDVEGIREVRSLATEGMGSVTLRVDTEYDLDVVLDEVKIRVDAISTFPGETERPIIGKARFKGDVLNVQIYGDLSEHTLKRMARDVADEIAALPDVTQVEVWGDRAYEISIEVDERTLEAYGLTLGGIADAVRRSSLDLSGGSIRTDSGDIRLRTDAQGYVGTDFERIPLLTREDGTRLTIGDIATVRDGFEQVERYALFNGQPSIGISVYAIGKENEITISQAVNAWVEDKALTLPEGVHLRAWADSAYYLRDRMNMMGKNLLMGSVLVLVILALFLELRLAFWVIVGLPVAFLGVFAFLPSVDVTINMLSLFGFILVLGIVVDDAIIIGESVHTEVSRYGQSVENVIRGAERVALPATFGVLTTIATFVPLTLVTGNIQAFADAIGWVVILALIFSLVESKLILPAHLAHVGPWDYVSALFRGKRPELNAAPARPVGIRRSVDRALGHFIDHAYTPALNAAIRHRYTTGAAFLAALIVAAGLVFGGQVRFVFFPNIQHDFVRAQLTMNEGVSDALTRAVLEELVAGLDAAEADVKATHGIDGELVRYNFAYMFSRTGAMIMAELTKSEDRELDPNVLATRWREVVGEIAGVKELKISARGHAGGGPPVAFLVTGNDYDRLKDAADALRVALRGYDGVFDITSTANEAARELKIELTPAGEASGLSRQDVARQVREAFYGAEAQRFQRGNDEVKVMVRYPEDERRSVGNLERMRIRTPDGRQIPFGTIATVLPSQADNAIPRVDGKRAITIQADVDDKVTTPSEVMTAMRRDHVDRILQAHPGVSFELAGASEEELDAQQQLLIGFCFGMLLIYSLMAIPLQSYVQPLLIMSVIPFGIIGAVTGHWLLGMNLSMISIMGIIALTGVVVNDAIIMVDYVNQAVAEGRGRMEAAIEAGQRRFRPILLTSLTTFFGLVPMVLERSVQAQVMIPMAVSLAFGILFATVITLLLVPALYVILEDIGRIGGRMLRPGASAPADPVTPRR